MKQSKPPDGAEALSPSTAEQPKKKSISTTCARADCHGRPHKGSIFCYPHDPGVIKTGGAPTGNLNAASPGSLYSRFLTDIERQDLARFGEIRGIENELQAARAVVMRMFQAGDNEGALRAIAQVARLENQQRREGGEAATGIIEAVTSIMEELGINGGLGDLSPGLN